MGPALREGRGWTGASFWVAISEVNEEGVGAWGNFEKGLLGGNNDFGAVEALLEANGFEGFDSEEVDMLKLVGGVVKDDALIANVPPALEVDPNENGGSAEEPNVGAFMDPNNPVPPVPVCEILVDPLIPF